MVTDDGKFSYDSDVLWLAEQGRPYYYGIICFLVYFEFYELALFYVIFAITLIWEIDESDRIEAELDHITAFTFRGPKHRIINIEIMQDYMENVDLDPYYSDNDPIFIDYFNNLDSSLILSNEPNFFISVQYVPISARTFDKHKLVKMGVDIEKAANFRELNYDSIQEGLMKFKTELISATKPEKKAIIKARMKKLLEVAAKFDYDLLVYKISVDSHNTVLLALYLQMGLYPISEYDFDIVAFSDEDSIIYTEYLYFYYFDKSAWTFFETDDDSNIDYESTFESDFRNLY